MTEDRSGMHAKIHTHVVYHVQLEAESARAVWRMISIWAFGLRGLYMCVKEEDVQLA